MLSWRYIRQVASVTSHLCHHNYMTLRIVCIDEKSQFSLKIPINVMKHLRCNLLSLFSLSNQKAIYSTYKAKSSKIHLPLSYVEWDGITVKSFLRDIKSVNLKWHNGNSHQLVQNWFYRYKSLSFYFKFPFLFTQTEDSHSGMWNCSKTWSLC